MKAPYKIEIVKSSWSFSEEYTEYGILDDIVAYLSRYKHNISIYISDHKGNDIASREFGVWTICQ